MMLHNLATQRLLKGYYYNTLRKKSLKTNYLWNTADKRLQASYRQDSYKWNVAEFSTEV